MNDIRRSILWVVFGFAMVLIWDKWQIHNGKPATFFPSSTPPAVTAPAQGAPAPKADASLPSASSNPASAGASAVPGAEASAPAAATRHEVTTDVLRLSFSSEGGALVGAQLLKHAQASGGADRDIKTPFTLLSQTAQRTYVAQSGLVGGNFPTHKTPMVLVGGAPTALADGQDSLQVRYESAEVGGVQLITTYTLKRGHYDIGVQHEVRNVGGAPVSPQLYRQLVRDGSTVESQTPFYSTFTGPAVYTTEHKFQKIEFKNVAGDKATYVKNATDGYVAMVQHYFATAWLLDAGVARENFVRQVADNLYSVGSLASLPAIAPGQSQTVQARLFVGPQDEKKLETLAPGLELVKDYGWLTILAKPLYWLLEKIHGFVGNWGWAIVLLVVLIKAAFYWLNASAYRSMAKMKAINPRIMEMRERLKSNPQQMQQEMMKIYREEKVNPLGGCFPILIQIPVFIALYWVLLSSVEMRNAPWIGWIHDLSSPDPFYILPLVMAITTMVQTALNPLPPDPLQAKLMWMMPLVFSVMFFFFPSGLVLYWITNNVLTIAQQAHINRRMGVPLKFNLPKFK
ncbi:MAG: membrane protein insertase YidC [Hydrogenophaga sp. SCN 70-13]|uniref:membrane protein insertase YidC n=1 Tax=unclassified Hydrogenophaga TaxID=2610897 RepID=UPI000868B914|nr:MULTISPECIES: membrane protein insertase YidC [unclassified Hydrogenophaga]MBN9370000.1 membrane protein insertase YidC [Hydrogenophaga sp.]ODT33446.1 MAG: membrane protein insertase YidC [Hydrogenophaga sp. SCN 70-13]OJV48733.1 MAG: membrane protein insertase YidC [Hydrogenophaga sp. 70-12]